MAHTLTGSARVVKAAWAAEHPAACPYDRYQRFLARFARLQEGRKKLHLRSFMMFSPIEPAWVSHCFTVRRHWRGGTVGRAAKSRSATGQGNAALRALFW